MSLHIAGTGWVTPLGTGVAEVWQRLLRGEEAIAETISGAPGQRSYPVFRVPASITKDLSTPPRLRRASAISRFAAAAGMAALSDAGLTNDAPEASRIALIFAVANGGVIYTKRFYHDIVASGANTASPLLFPETVFNAPASHLAALLGITGTTYTLVGDGAVGLLALRMAEDLMMNETFDYCLVVGAEETDWLLCDAYAKWRLVRAAPPLEPFHIPAKGTILSEGAGAVLLARSGPVRIDVTDGGSCYSHRRQAGKALEQVLRNLDAPAGTMIIGSGNGTFVDAAEAEAVSRILPDAFVYTPKPALGESVGASGLWQTIVAVTALRTGQLPPLLHGGSGTALPIRISVAKTRATQSTVVLGCGLNQQVAGLRLSL
jgi:3-oxoacyl-(acyl-carrier-protein) synthase